MKILVTGATGQLGSKVIERLLEHVPAKHLIASVSNPKRAEGLKKKGVDVRHGDFDFSHTLEHAFKGADRMLLISTMGDNATRIRQHLAAVQAAKQAKVKFIAYTSIAKADTTSISLGEVHRVTEAAIKSSGIHYCILRNNWYLENELKTIEGAVNGAAIVTCAGEGRVGWALRSDYAVAAANAVSDGDSHHNQTYELSGPPLSYAGLGAILSQVLGKNVPVQSVAENVFIEALSQSGMAKPMVGFVAGIQRGIRDGALDVDSGDLEKLLGRPVTPLSQSLETMIKGIAVPA